MQAIATDTARLIEREGELEQVDALVAAACEGRGRCLVVAGQAGIGKTSLLGAGVERAAAQGLRTLAARAAEPERDFGWGVVRQLIEPVVRQASRQELDELLGGAARLAAPIVAPGEARQAGEAGPEAASAAQHGLYWLLDNLAARSPVLLVVDDAQWADPASLRFLLYLARRLDGMRVGVLVGWRTGDPGSPQELLDSLRAEPLADSVEPALLSEGATARLVRREIAEPADRGFMGACHAATGGNPFLLTTLLSAIAAGDLEATEEAVERVRADGPAAVARSVFVRLARLGRPAVSLARAVAVLDVDSDLRQAAQLAELTVEEALVAAAALQQDGIFASGESLRLAHPILRGAIYGDLAPADKERLHRRAARSLDAAGAEDRAAAHLLLTQPSGDPWVVDRLARAGERALRRGVGETAVALLERAMAEPAGGEAARVLLSLGGAEQLLVDPAAIDHLRAAMDAAADPALRWKAGLQLARETNLRLGHDDALEVLESLLAEQRQAGDPQALETEAYIAYFGNFADAHALGAGERIERVARGRAGTSDAERLVLLVASLHRAQTMRGTAVEVIDLVERAQPERFLSRFHESSVALWGCGSLLYAGRLEEGRAFADEMLVHTRRTGGLVWAASSSLWRANAAWALGDLRDADAYVREALDLIGTRSPVTVPGMVSVVAEMQRLRGELDAADATLDSYGYAEGPLPRFAGVWYVLMTRALLRLDQHRPEEARRDAEALLEAERKRGGIVPWMRSAAALALHAAGEEERALEVARRDVEVSERWGVPGILGTALRTLGVLEGGARGLERLAASVRELEGSPFRFELAASLVEHGAALRRANQRQAARDPLARGMELAQRCGATALAARAADELTASGARPRPVGLQGIDTLTASERRVAQLAAGGLSNREIAQALFVTRKTVETHLRHVFQKLDVDSRTRLPELLAGEAVPAEPGPTATIEVVGARPEGPPARPVVATVLAIGVIDAARRRSQLGEQSWREVCERYEQLVRREIDRCGGKVINAPADNFVATFDSATAAVGCAQHLVTDTPASLGLVLRAGVHCGEVALVDGDVRGLPVTIAGRILALAAAGEALCSGTVVELVAGSSLRFIERGTVELDGVPGRWRVCAAA